MKIEGLTEEECLELSEYKGDKIIYHPQLADADPSNDLPLSERKKLLPKPIVRDTRTVIGERLRCRRQLWLKYRKKILEAFPEEKQRSVAMGLLSQEEAASYKAKFDELNAEYDARKKVIMETTDCDEMEDCCKDVIPPDDRTLLQKISEALFGPA